MEKQMNIPTLRFPEFQREWERKPLIALTENGFSNGAFNDPRKVGRGYRIINVKDMYVDGTINADNLTRVEIDEKEFFKNRVEFGDIFFTRSSLVKEGIAYSNVNLNELDDLTFDGHLIRMRPKKELYSPVFLYYNFATSNARKQFIKRGKTTTMTTIGQDDIAKVETTIPTLPEQTKIATFLTAVDSRLTQLKQKKSLLEQYKKGVMQKIFDQEIRFKDEDGNEFPDWEEKKLGEVTYKVDKKNKLKEQLPVYSISNKNGFVPQSEQFDGMDSNERGYDTSLYKIIENNTFAYNPARINVGSIGYSGTIGRVIVSSLYVCFKTVNTINDLFFNYFLETNHFKSSVINKGEGGVRIYLFYENFSEITFNMPCIEEQTKIANFLSAIDEKISLCGQQIEKTEQWKKGLLQQMFC